MTERTVDRFGRLALEKRPDGTETSITLSRAKDASGAWRVTQRTATRGGGDDTVEFDSLGRPIRWFWHGPSPQGASGEPPRLMQEVTYDARSGKVARRSVPVSEGTAESKMLPPTARCWGSAAPRDAGSQVWLVGRADRRRDGHHGGGPRGRVPRCAATSTGIGAAVGVPAMGLPSIPLLKRGERFPGRLHTYIEPMVRTKN